MVQASAEETAYKLVFESDAVIPIEVAKPSSRIVSIDKGSNDEIWKVKLDLIEKEREIARVKEEVMKLQIARKYNRHVSLKSFKERDVVLRQIELQRKVVGKGKLTSTWEGPYCVVKEVEKGGYKIAKLEGRKLLRIWNASSLWRNYN